MGKALKTHAFVHGHGDKPQLDCLEGIKNPARGIVDYLNDPSPPIKSAPFITQQLQDTPSPTLQFDSAFMYLNQSILETNIPIKPQSKPEEIVLQKRSILNVI